jgi:hypothetical protein
MCKITQPLNVALAIAVTHPLPDGLHVEADHHGLKLQGAFPDPDALAHALDLTRDEKRDHVATPRPYVAGSRFRSWHGVIQNIFVELVDVQPIETGEQVA